MSEVNIVPAGTYEALEQSARRIASPVHFVIERLTGGGWDNLGGNVPIKPTYPTPVLFREQADGSPAVFPG